MRGQRKGSETRKQTNREIGRYTKIAKEEKEEVCVERVEARRECQRKSHSPVKMSSLQFSPSSKKHTYKTMTQQMQDVKVGEKGLQPVIITAIRGSLEFMTPWKTLLKTNER